MSFIDDEDDPIFVRAAVIAIAVVLATIVAVMLYGCASHPPPIPVPVPLPELADTGSRRFLLVAAPVAAQTRSPNADRTPGVVRPLSVATICATRWGRDFRHVTVAMRRQVFAAYGVPDAQRKNYELDHLVPRELGGADAVGNLWPQRWLEARVKDWEENRLHRAVCAGTMTLAAAQQHMRNWGREQ